MDAGKQRIRARFLAASLLFVSGLPLGSAAPSLEYVHPPGAAVGSTNTVRVSGKFDPWPPKVWLDGSGVAFLAQTNKGEFSVVVNAEARPGVRLIRFYNEDGGSEPRPFVIGPGPEITEVEPTDHFDKAQTIDALPITINGRLDQSGDVDSYAIALKAGQTLNARIDSYVLMSRLDAVLRVVTTHGLQLAWNHDFATIDPQLSWTATNDLTAVVQVFGFPYPATADIRLTGGEGAIYRLHLGLADGTHSPSPAVNLTAVPPPLVELPFTTAGCIREPAQLHRVRLHPSEGGWIAAEVHAESIGSPLDAWLQLEDKDGKQLQRNDDANESRDPRLEWRAERDTDYTIVVGSLTQQAGDEQRFELFLHRVEPDYTAAAAVSSLAIKPGTTNDLKVTFTRLRGFTNELQVLAKDLPEGVSCEPVSVGEKGAEAKLILMARTNAPAFQGPIQVYSRPTADSRERVVPFPLTGGSVDNGVPGGYRTLLADHIETLWLTVLKAEAPKTEATPEKAGK